jgi:hypothetical protein
VRFRVLFSFGLTLPTLLAATVAHAQEAPTMTASPPPAPPAADLPPPGARTTHIVAGLATTVVSYGFALGASFLVEPADFNGAKDLRIPLAGPWMALGRTGCPASEPPDCNKVPLVLGAILTIFDGVAQAGGLGIVGEGLFLNTSNARAARQKAEGPVVHALPFNFGKDGVGLGVVGTF